ncbi:uncharacterized protein [Coffea arabica]|uniref:Integrase catalytic domain-containing protein n=1 Tax=Coffea arabica TaxID=13443 RepID=A0ABM4VC84_COFAR
MPYFQTHPIVVVTDQPLKQILFRPDMSGRMVKWVLELSEYDLDFQPRTTIKTQALADFIAEDNGRQFAENSFRNWCAELRIQQHFTFVGHSQANGQVKNVNRTILQRLKTRIGSIRIGWMDELPSIFWTYQTTPRTATQETLFVLTYGAEAVIPANIGLPSGRVQNFIAQGNEGKMRFNLDLLEQKREEAFIRIAKYKGQVARHYNARARHLSFKSGDLVL